MLLRKSQKHTQVFLRMFLFLKFRISKISNYCPTTPVFKRKLVDDSTGAIYTHTKFSQFTNNSEFVSVSTQNKAKIYVFPYSSTHSKSARNYTLPLIVSETSPIYDYTFSNDNSFIIYSAGWDSITSYDITSNTKTTRNLNSSRIPLNKPVTSLISHTNTTDITLGCRGGNIYVFDFREKFTKVRTIKNIFGGNITPVKRIGMHGEYDVVSIPSNGCMLVYNDIRYPNSPQSTKRKFIMESQPIFDMKISYNYIAIMSACAIKLYNTIDDSIKTLYYLTNSLNVYHTVVKHSSISFYKNKFLVFQYCNKDINILNIKNMKTNIYSAMTPFDIASLDVNERDGTLSRMIGDSLVVEKIEDSFEKRISYGGF